MALKNPLNENLVKGSDLLIWVDGKTIGFSQSMTISMSGEATAVSNKSAGNGWQSNVLASRSWTASSDAVYAIDVYSTECSYDKLYDAYINGTPVALTWGVNQNHGATTRVADVDKVPTENSNAVGWKHNATAPYYSGSAIITNLELSGSNEDAASYSVEFTGSGSITKVQPNSAPTGDTD